MFAHKHQFTSAYTHFFTIDCLSSRYVFMLASVPPHTHTVPALFQIRELLVQAGLAQTQTTFSMFKEIPREVGLCMGSYSTSVFTS